MSERGMGDQIYAERIRLQREIDGLNRKSQEMAQKYHDELQKLRKEIEYSVQQANDELIRQHRIELDAVSAAYNKQRNDLLVTIRETRSDLERYIKEEYERIGCQIQRVEQRIAEQDARDKDVADEYKKRMKDEWEDLRRQEELRRFTESHDQTIAYVEEMADEAYKRQQYQAVTAMMANSSALICCWKSEAQSLLEEWQALHELCNEMLGCMRVAMESTNSCEGAPTICLRRYDEVGFQRADELLATDELSLAEPQQLTIEDMRKLLHEMERDQRFINDAIEHAIVLHRAHVRRFRNLSVITKGLEERRFQRLSACYCDGDMLSGVKALYHHRYQKDKLILQIKTSQPELGRTELTVTLYPYSAIAGDNQHTFCSELASYIKSLINGQEDRPTYIQTEKAYRTKDGLYSAVVSMQY